jgi:hypothetical protein
LSQNKYTHFFGGEFIISLGIATCIMFVIMFVSVIEPKLWQKTVLGGPHGGHLEIQHGSHVTSSPMAPFDWPDSKT